MLRKFGQVPRHRIVEVAKPALPQLPEGHGGEGFTGRKPVQQMRRSHRFARPGLAHGQMQSLAAIPHCTDLTAKVMSLRNARR